MSTTQGSRKAHTGGAVGSASTARPWYSAITATDSQRVYVRGRALDSAIGEETFPAILLRLWRGGPSTASEAGLLGACLVAAIDHGPLAPSTLTARTITSAGGTPMAALAGGILAFGEHHGAVVTRGMELLQALPPDVDLATWAEEVFSRERAAGRRLPGIGHRWHAHDLRAEKLISLAAGLGGERQAAAVHALADRVAAHTGHPVAVNIDAALAVALTVLQLKPEFGDFAFACARAFGLAAHIVEEKLRERPMRTIDPTAAQYDGPPLPTDDEEQQT